MKTFTKIMILLFAVLPLNIAMANKDISGTWQGELIPAPGAEMTIQFIISQGADGSYAVVLNSPEEGGIKNIEASEVVYDAGILKLDVAELSGSYEGVVGEGIIDGEWKQEGTSMPLDLSPYEKPVLSKEDQERLLGEWHGALKLPFGELTIVSRFEKTESGEFVGFFDSPDQGGYGIPITDMEISDGILTIKAERIRAEIKGKLTDTEITGEFKQGPEPLPITLKKGKYIPPVDEFKLSEEDKALLLGEWHGQLETPATPVAPANSLTAVIRFEISEDGQFKGYTSSPDQGAYDTPITSLEMSGSDITFKVRSQMAEFTGQISGDVITGEAKQGPQTMPLTLKKGKYMVPVHSLNLPEEATKLLSGKWKGQLGPLALVFRFETSDTGDFVAFIDVPTQKAKGIPVTESSFSDGELSLTAKGINSEFKGQLSENELAGEWKQGGMANPLSLIKE